MRPGAEHYDDGLGDESWTWTGQDGHRYYATKHRDGTDVEIQHSFFCRGCKSLHDRPESITMDYQAFLTLIGY